MNTITLKILGKTPMSITTLVAVPLSLEQKNINTEVVGCVPDHHKLLTNVEDLPYLFQPNYHLILYRQYDCRGKEIRGIPRHFRLENPPLYQP